MKKKKKLTPSMATTLSLGKRHVRLIASNQLLNNSIHKKQAAI